MGGPRPRFAAENGGGEAALSDATPADDANARGNEKRGQSNRPAAAQHRHAQGDGALPDALDEACRRSDVDGDQASAGAQDADHLSAGGAQVAARKVVEYVAREDRIKRGVGKREGADVALT